MMLCECCTTVTLKYTLHHLIRTPGIMTYGAASVNVSPPCVSSKLGCKPATSLLGMLLLDIVRSEAHDNTTTSCSARGQSSSGCVRCLYGLGRTLLLLLHLLICVEQLSVFTLELIAHSLCNNGIPLAEQLSEISWTQKC